MVHLVVYVVFIIQICTIIRNLDEKFKITIFQFWKNSSAIFVHPIRDTIFELLTRKLSGANVD